MTELLIDLIVGMGSAGPGSAETKRFLTEFISISTQASRLDWLWKFVEKARH